MQATLVRERAVVVTKMFGKMRSQHREADESSQDPTRCNPLAQVVSAAGASGKGPDPSSCKSCHRDVRRQSCAMRQDEIKTPRMLWCAGCQRRLVGLPS